MSLAGKFLNLLFGGEPAAFPSRYSVAESVDRLQSVVVANPLRTLFQPALIGHVSADRVNVRHYQPFVRNSWKPLFDGTFVERDGCVFLEGCFTTHIFVKVFSAVWFSIALFMLAIGLVVAITSGGDATAPPVAERILPILAPVMLLLFFLVMVTIGKAMGRRDSDYISAEIRRILGA